MPLDLSISYLTVSVGTISMKVVTTRGAWAPIPTPCQGWRRKVSMGEQPTTGSLRRQTDDGAARDDVFPMPGGCVLWGTLTPHAGEGAGRRRRERRAHVAFGDPGRRGLCRGGGGVGRGLPPAAR